MSFKYVEGEEIKVQEGCTPVILGGKVFVFQSGKNRPEPKQNIINLKIPEKYRNININLFKKTDNNKMCIEAISNFSKYFHRNKDRSMLIVGKVGTGKTSLCYLFLKNILEKGYKGELITTSNIFLNIQNTYNAGCVDTEKQYFEKLCRLDLLIIDDIGIEVINDWSYPKLYEIVNQRYNNKKATVFTSNMTVDLLYKKLDERLVSRMIEMTKGFKFKLIDEDWRNKK